MLALVATALVAALAPSAASAAVDDGLTHHWTFDEAPGPTVIDSVGGANGTISSEASRSLGVVGAGAVTTATTRNSYIEFPASAFAPGTADFTVSFWIRNRATTNALTDVFGNRSEASHGNFLSIRANANYNIEVDEDGGGLNYGGFATFARARDPQWHNLAVTRRGTDVRAFLDGVQTGQVTTAGVTNIGVTKTSRLGRRVEGCCTDWTSLNADYDDLRIYNRALSANELLKLSGKEANTQTLLTAASGAYGDPIPLGADVRGSGQGVSNPNHQGTVTFQRDSAGTWVDVSDCAAVPLGGPDGNTAACSSTRMPAGTYAIRAVYNGAPGDFKGSESLAPTLTYTKRKLTVTPASGSRAYGQANPDLAGQVQGLANGDPIQISWITDATDRSDVGDYDVRSELDDPTDALANYDLEQRHGNLRVTKARLDARADDASRVYGQPDPVLTGTLDGVVAGDDLTVTEWRSDAGDHAAVGAHEITPTIADPGERLGNYDLHTSGQLTVTPAPLAAVGADAARAYGDPNPDLIGTLDGLVEGDDVTATWTTGATQSSPVGDYDTTPVLSGAQVGNYSVDVDPGTLSVTKRKLTAAAGDVTRPFGQENPSLEGTLDGVANDDDVTAAYSSAATAASKPGVYEITVDVQGAESVLANYDITTTPGNLTVVDEHGPTLIVPGNVTAEATGADGADVTYDASATDDANEDPAVDCDPASGSTFALGTTTVDCTANDGTNTSTASFDVTVVDTTAPELTLPSPAAEATGPEGAAVAYSATADDKVDGGIEPSCSAASGSTFPVGTTTVRCTATDAAGNSTSGDFTVGVTDTTAPVLSLPADKSVLATSPSGARVTFDATAADTVEGSLPVACTPASGTQFAIGSTTVSCSASDSRGNVSRGSFAVEVKQPTATQITTSLIETVAASPAYQQLSPALKAVVGTLIQNAVDRIDAIQSARQKAAAIRVAQNSVQVLVAVGGLTQQQADAIKGLIGLV